jgi:hypothetical protein
MKKHLMFLALVAILLFAGSVLAQVSVNGYNRSDGTYVQPHHRSSPNGTVTDNYSFKGNVNPYTGQNGSNSYRSNPSSPYYDGSSSSRNSGQSSRGLSGN